MTRLELCELMAAAHNEAAQNLRNRQSEAAVQHALVGAWQNLAAEERREEIGASMEDLHRDQWEGE